MIALLLSAGALAGGPQAPAVLPDGTGALDGGGELRADSGAGQLWFGARTPLRESLGGEWFGGFGGVVGFARTLGFGVGMVDVRRLALDERGDKIDPGRLTLALRYAPVAGLEDVAVSIATSRPAGPASEHAASWQLLGAWGHDFGGARAFGDVAFVVKEDGGISGWAGVGGRTPVAGRLTAGVDGWVSTEWSAEVSGELGVRAGKGVEIALVGGPRWDDAPDPRYEAALRLSFLVDPRDHDLPADGDADGVVDGLDACPALAAAGPDGCEPPPEERRCGCALDELSDTKLADLLDELRHPVEGQVHAIQVWGPPDLNLLVGWQAADADAAVVLDVLTGAGVSPRDVRVIPMGAAKDGKRPRLKVTVMEEARADLLLQEMESQRPKPVEEE